MVNIVLIDNEKKLGKEIFMILSRYSGTFYSSAEENISVGNTIEYIITESPLIEELNVKNSVIIIGSVVKEYNCNKQIFESCHSVLASSENVEGLKLLKGANASVFVCGMSVRDTVSITSIVGDTATICIKRAFCNLFGEETEECEIPIVNEMFSDYALMCAGAILLLNAKTEN